MPTVLAGLLVDGTDHPARAECAIDVERGRIVAIRSDATVPADTAVLDFRDYCVVPGLIDSHVHLVFSGGPDPLHDVLLDDDQHLLLRAASAARQALGSGVTTLRDLGGRGGVTFKVRDAIDAGWLPGPRVLPAGAPITITAGHCYFLGGEADGEVGVRQQVRRQLKAGASCLKVMATGGRMTPGTNVGRAQFTTDELAAVVEEGRRGRVSVAAHAIGTAGIRGAVEAGVTTVEHCSWLAPDGGVDFDEAVAERMRDQRTAAVPALLPVKLAGESRADGLSAGLREQLAVRDEILGHLRRMAEIGTPILGGTDAGVGWTRFDGLWREAELLVTEVGLSPTAALQSVTSRPADILGIGADVGRLTEGRCADLVALEADPTEQIGALRRLHAVVKGGQLVALDGMVR